jgi:hypothetical protein
LFIWYPVGGWEDIYTKDFGPYNFVDFKWVAPKFKALVEADTNGVAVINVPKRWRNNVAGGLHTFSLPAPVAPRSRLSSWLPVPEKIVPVIMNTMATQKKKRSFKLAAMDHVSQGDHFS